MLGANIKIAVGFLAAIGGTTQQTPVDIFHRLHHIQRRPIHVAEHIRLSQQPHKLPHGDVTIFELDFRNLQALALIEVASENLQVGRPDRRLGRNFRKLDTGAIAVARQLIQLEHLRPQGAGIDTPCAGIAHLVVDARATADQNPAGIFAEGRGAVLRFAGFFREDRPKLNFQGIVADAVGMLIAQGLIVVGKGGQELRHLAEGSAVVKQVNLRAPVTAFLGFLAQAAQVGYGFLAKVVGIFLGVDEGIDQGG